MLKPTVSKFQVSVFIYFYSIFIVIMVGYKHLCSTVCVQLFPTRGTMLLLDSLRLDATLPLIPLKELLLLMLCLLC